MKLIPVMLLSGCMLANLGAVASAAPTTAQRRQVDSLAARLLKAGQLFNEGRTKQSADEIERIQRDYEKLAELRDPELTQLLEPLHGRLLKANALLKSKGFSLPEPKPPGAIAAELARTGGLSFAREIAPILVDHCGYCHMNRNRARGNLTMNTFAQLMIGGDSGSPIKPMVPEESLLIRRVKGEGGEPRMPLDRTPLTEAALAKLEKWIAEGAVFDGDDPTLEIDHVAALAKTRLSTPDQLRNDRGQLAERNWRLGMQKVHFSKYETDSFMLLGDLDDSTIQDLGQRIETALRRFAATFNVSPERFVIKGRTTLFVFRERYGYTEFGQMVEQRQIPVDWRGHWRFTELDAYGAFVAARSDDYASDVMAAQQFAGVYVASLGKSVPRWFAEGSARAAASRVAPKDPRVLAWDDELTGMFGSLGKPDDFLTGKLRPELADVAAYSFAKFLMRNARSYNTLLEAIRGGQDFERAFSATYNGSPAQVAERWVAGTDRSAKRKRP